MYTLFYVEQHWYPIALKEHAQAIKVTLPPVGAVADLPSGHGGGVELHFIGFRF